MLIKLKKNYFDSYIESMTIRFINDRKDLVQLNKIIKLDNDITRCILPQKLEQNNYIICFIDEKLNQILSFIWFGIYENILLGKYIHTIFSYTFKKNRSNGFNKILRLKLEDFAIRNKVYKIVSVPFDKSPSLNILLNLGYISMNNFYLKNLVKN